MDNKIITVNNIEISIEYTVCDITKLRVAIFNNRVKVREDGLIFRIASYKRRHKTNVANRKGFNEWYCGTKQPSPSLRMGYYYRIDISGKRMVVHRLVALAFIENLDANNTIVNHIDNNPTNNNVTNLEWSNVNLNAGIQSNNARVVGQYTMSGDLVKVWHGAASEMRAHGYRPTSVYACTSGKFGAKSHRNYIWKYLDAEEHLNYKLGIIDTKNKCIDYYLNKLTNKE